MDCFADVKFTTFYFKTFMYQFFFNWFSYNRKIHALKRDNYDFSVEKHPVRNKHHGKGGWKSTAINGIRYRDYSDYDEYIAHQKAKWDEMIAAKGGLTAAEVVSYRKKFFRRFRKLHSLIPLDARILCLGARQGTEVEVLRDLGFVHAQGIDLNPGPDNPWVVPGDFMNIDSPDGAVDLIYSNAVDHAFDLDRFFKEHSRVLKKDGYVLYDLAVESNGQGSGVFESVEWESDEHIFHILLKNFDRVIHVASEPNWKWILLQGSRFSA
ncbi:MAG: class I SAM-dependent methyltransferase [Magnetococcales bacterium]|nr:class I SAM-dependent methyltransferase [Magnetococcales bacterium]